MSRSHEVEYSERTRHHGGHLGLSVVRHPHDDPQAVSGLVEESPGVVPQHRILLLNRRYPQLGMVG